MARARGETRATVTVAIGVKEHEFLRRWADSHRATLAAAMRRFLALGINTYLQLAESAAREEASAVLVREGANDRGAPGTSPTTP